MAPRIFSRRAARKASLSWRTNRSYVAYASRCLGSSSRRAAVSPSPSSQGSGARAVATANDPSEKTSTAAPAFAGGGATASTVFPWISFQDSVSPGNCFMYATFSWLALHFSSTGIVHLYEVEAKVEVEVESSADRQMRFNLNLSLSLNLNLSCPARGRASRADRRFRRS